MEGYVLFVSLFLAPVISANTCKVNLTVVFVQSSSNKFAISFERVGLHQDMQGLEELLATSHGLESCPRAMSEEDT